MIFPEAVTDLSMYTRFKAAVRVPILANITEFGQTPLYSREELGAAGVDLVLYCCSAYRAMNAAALRTYESSAAPAASGGLAPHADPGRAVPFSRLPCL